MMEQSFERGFAAITTSDAQRARLWLHIFGSDTLPVLAPRARFQEHPGHPHGLLAYDLDLRALRPAQRQRFAGYIHRRYNIDYTLALAEVDGATAWPIKAGPDIVVLQPEESNASPAVSFWPGGAPHPPNRPVLSPVKSLAPPAGLF